MTRAAGPCTEPRRGPTHTETEGPHVRKRERSGLRHGVRGTARGRVGPKARGRFVRRRRVRAPAWNVCPSPRSSPHAASFHVPAAHPVRAPSPFRRGDEQRRRRVVPGVRQQKWTAGKVQGAEGVGVHAYTPADCVFVPGLSDEGAIAAVIGATDLPVNVLLDPGRHTVRRLADLGVARISTGSLLFRAALGAVAGAVRETGFLRETVGPGPGGCPATRRCRLCCRTVRRGEREANGSAPRPRGPPLRTRRRPENRTIPVTMMRHAPERRVTPRHVRPRRLRSLSRSGRCQSARVRS